MFLFNYMYSCLYIAKVVKIHILPLKHNQVICFHQSDSKSENPIQTMIMFCAYPIIPRLIKREMF